MYGGKIKRTETPLHLCIQNKEFENFQVTAIEVDDFNVQFHHVSRAVKINRSNRLPFDYKRRQLPLSKITIGRSLAPLKAMKEFISMSEVFLTPVTFTFTLILKLWLTLIRSA